MTFFKRYPGDAPCALILVAVMLACCSCRGIHLLMFTSDASVTIDRRNDVVRAEWKLKGYHHRVDSLNVHDLDSVCTLSFQDKR